MIGNGKIIGAILIAAGAVILLIAGLFVGTGLASGQLRPAGAVLGLALCGVAPLLILGGGGAYLFVRGRAEAQDLAGVRRKERLLGLIQAQGKAPLNTIMLELHMTPDDVRRDIYELVQQRLFSGYVDWSSNTFYSKDAASVGSTKCPNCAGTRELAGQGIVKCQYCGVELFIPPAG